ncbi:(p)ppGpp synthetase I, SpoT/RelA [Olsenella uli DSM 7084]|uniref:(P)ppGpp synthetase I, SpoT/RelA n=1 Tax=Olsenella uli (strain ATCC 49627 / DSM 7084 / CCUG 31166 / CIP 109912 / JCM 12494 / LMG 11480 / NCIMB 702895 / VPI D76D-27C) TaxID=633147 RepID=E1QZN6_OLSUV|nr:bifunctional (p)ppGpp synthetase/guanosine-3',5'-bis(diphosphate) 3'-pyrophosphohydrolase [Olsenella uli]ADK67850.1 (p)ppGpp synthetase I, SpoT/RelA [Olsenella uli DSM 7084]EUB30534.1 putative GTP diphosphokinase [Olsenella uli MSTE5]
MGEATGGLGSVRRRAVPQADNWRVLRNTCVTYLDAEALAKIDAAYSFAADFHRDQRRRSGEPYINHPVEVALILAKDLKMDEDPICAALLHDTVEDTSATLDDLTERFGATVAELVDGVTKLTSIEVSSMDEKQALNLRKMFLAMSKDIRVVIIKLADRLHNMRTLAALPPDRRVFKARETMDVYAPLADRLGISSIKWELEDLAFFYLNPDEYERIARMVQESRAQREQNTDEAIKTLGDELARVGITGFQIHGRPKHLWSIYQKMTRKGKKFTDIYDLIAIRVLTESVGDCYSTLGAVHTVWHPLPGRFKDYIAMPKPNGYQSLHTTVIGFDARPIEIQIRTFEMHSQAEYGIAAHWLYKKSGNSSGRMSRDEADVDSQINWIRRSLDWATDEEMGDPHEYLNSLRVELFEDEIFVFTPKGEVMSLRRDSTPLDFAYAVHTEVGNHCVGAKVNGSVAPLTYRLQSGDRIEILTNKNARPSHDWLNVVVTPSAKAKIRKYFTTVSKVDDAEQGRSDIAHELRKRGYGISNQRTTKAIERVTALLDYVRTNDLFAAVGTGKISPKQVANRIEAILEENSPERLAEQERAAARKAAHERAMTENRPLVNVSAKSASDRRRRNNCGVVAKGDPDLLVHLAHCCNPVAGDEIVGFVTRGRGVSVHRASCPNCKDLLNHPERMIDVEWDATGATEFQVEIVVEATDRMGLLKDVTIALGDAGGNILSAATQTTSTGVARLRFLVAISDASRLGPLLATVNKVPSVYDARRIMPGEGGNEMKRRTR